MNTAIIAKYRLAWCAGHDFTINGRFRTFPSHLVEKVVQGIRFFHFGRH